MPYRNMQLHAAVRNIYIHIYTITFLYILHIQFYLVQYESIWQVLFPSHAYNTTLGGGNNNLWVGNDGNSDSWHFLLAIIYIKNLMKSRKVKFLKKLIVADNITAFTGKREKNIRRRWRVFGMKMVSEESIVRIAHSDAI